MFEIRAVEATVAGEKAVGLARGVGADQEVGCHSRPGASSLAICLPSDAGFEGGLRLERTELQAQPVEGFLGCRNRREQTGDLRPHYLARDERAASKLPHDLVRGTAELEDSVQLIDCIAWRLVLRHHQTSSFLTHFEHLAGPDAQAHS